MDFNLLGNFNRRGSFQAEILFYFVYQLLDRNNIVIVSLFTWHIPPCYYDALLSVLRSNHFYAFIVYSLIFLSSLHHYAHRNSRLESSYFFSFCSLFLCSLFILYILSCYDFSFTAHSRTPPRNATPTSFGWKNVDVLDKIEFSVSHTLAISLLEFLFILFIYFLLCYPSRGSSHFSNVIRFLNFNPDCAKNYSLLFVFCFYIIWRGWLDSPQ